MDGKITADDLRDIITDYTAKYPDIKGVNPFWRSPLLATAPADDRFDILPKIAAHDHALPKDLLPSARSVVVFFVPFVKALAVENHKGDVPCRNWGLAYEATNDLINRLSKRLKAFLENKGFDAELTPATHNFDHKRLVSRWSHKHLGYVAGLGRFGVNAQFITPAGCAGRMGSLVTSAALGANPLVTERELCLHKNGEKCLICAKRCPVQAVSKKGIDRKKCWERLKSNLRSTKALAGLGDATHVCGKCQVLVPCSLKIPEVTV